MQILDRRELLRCLPNPATGLDYMSKFAGQIKNLPSVEFFTVEIRYVPDRLVLDPACLGVYLSELSGREWSPLETLTTTLLDDLQNQVIPRWVQVRLIANRTTDGIPICQTIIAEDAQPGWKNDVLLGRMG